MRYANWSPLVVFFWICMSGCARPINRSQPEELLLYASTRGDIDHALLLAADGTTIRVDGVLEDRERTTEQPLVLQDWEHCLVQYSDFTETGEGTGFSETLDCRERRLGPFLAYWWTNDELYLGRVDEQRLPVHGLRMFLLTYLEPQSDKGRTLSIPDVVEIEKCSKVGSRDAPCFRKHMSILLSVQNMDSIAPTYVGQFVLFYDNGLVFATATAWNRSEMLH